VARSPFGLHLLTHESSEALLRDPRFHPGVAKLCEASDITEGRFYDDFTSSMLAVSGGAHRKLRRPVNPFFSSKAVEGYRGWLRGFLERTIDGLRDREVIEVQEEVSAPMPAALFCQMVGAPEDEAPFVARVSDASLQIFHKDPACKDEILAAYDELAVWCEDLIAQKRCSPGDDLVSFLAQEDQLDEDEVVNILTLILQASTDNTSNQLSIAVQLLAEHPAEWERLRTDRSWIGPVVDEAMRLRPRVTTGNRTTDEDVELLGLEVPAGSWVFSSVLAANRDPNRYAEPDRFVPGRPEGSSQLLFGLGPHYCIGAGLARFELEVALDVLADRWTSFELAGDPVPVRTWVLDGLLSLPVTPAWA